MASLTFLAFELISKKVKKPYAYANILMLKSLIYFDIQVISKEKNLKNSIWYNLFIKEKEQGKHHHIYGQNKNNKFHIRKINILCYQ